mmetsp:Transcript_5713/g.7702  ORF Transcript_5713/g.7702 Transcript_5713/m.7702 type:complete len:82 (+) Transcript_5713:261-506(+)
MFQYLRLLCLEYHLPELIGVLTNYQEWIFVGYNLDREVRKVYNKEAQMSNHVKALIFDMCDTINLRDSNLDLQKNQLWQVI